MKYIVLMAVIIANAHYEVGSVVSEDLWPEDVRADSIANLIKGGIIYAEGNAPEAANDELAETLAQKQTELDELTEKLDKFRSRNDELAETLLIVAPKDPEGLAKLRVSELEVLASLVREEDDVPTKKGDLVAFVAAKRA